MAALLKDRVFPAGSLEAIAERESVRVGCCFLPVEYSGRWKSEAYTCLFVGRGQVVAIVDFYSDGSFSLYDSESALTVGWDLARCRGR
jgi:hypothetical protein